MADPAAFPLAWPAGRPRTPWNERKPARFGSASGAHNMKRPITIAVARERLQDELDLLRAGSPVLSSNVELRLDGQPRSGMPDPVDPGAACYFVLRGRQLALPCDRWDSVAGNIAAIAAHIGALRGMDRWGVGTVEQAFAGYTLLPSEGWRGLLNNPGNLAEATAAFKRAMKTAHPDAGGSHDAAARLTAAMLEARRHFGG